MKITETKLTGVFLIEMFSATDCRGSFRKPFSTSVLRLSELNADFRESYYSVSKNNVIRGMHFQIPPFDHEKLIYVPSGKILDVVLDLRDYSATYGQAIGIHLSDSNNMAIYISKGFAHGFASLEENTIVTYLQTTEYSPEHDSGVRYDSFNFEWNIPEAIISDRDANFISFDELKSPFVKI